MLWTIYEHLPNPYIAARSEVGLPGLPISQVKISSDRDVLRTELQDIGLRCYG